MDLDRCYPHLSEGDLACRWTFRAHSQYVALPSREFAERLTAQPLELTRNFSFEESQLLAKDREEVVLRDAMAQDLANLVLRRLEAL